MTTVAVERPFATVPTLTDGGVIVCVAPGPSLLAADLVYALDHAPVILVSDAARTFRPGLWEAGDHASRAEIIYSSDKSWWMRHWKALAGVEGVKMRVHNSGDKPTARPADGVHCPACRLRLPTSGKSCWCVRAGLVTLKNFGVRGLSLDPTGICTGNNSGTSAINVAVLAGAKRIVLLGYDMGPMSGRRHFYNTEPVIVSSPFMQFRELTTELAPRLRDAGIHVINASRVSALDCFDRASLESVV